MTSEAARRAAEQIVEEWSVSTGQTVSKEWLCDEERNGLLKLVAAVLDTFAAEAVRAERERRGAAMNQEPFLEKLEAAWLGKGANEDGEVDIPLRDLVTFLRDITLRISRLEEQALREEPRCLDISKKGKK